MSEHKFKIGQLVNFRPPGQKTIVYTILQRLPSEGGGEPHERIVSENELRDASHLEDKS
jgi:hypothetical protein